MRSRNHATVAFQDLEPPYTTVVLQVLFPSPGETGGKRLLITLDEGGSTVEGKAMAELDLSDLIAKLQHLDTMEDS